MAWGALTVLLVKEPVRGRLDEGVGSSKVQVNFKDVYTSLMATPAFKYLTIAAFLGGFSTIAFGSWAIAMFERIFDISNQVFCVTCFRRKVPEPLTYYLQSGFWVLPLSLLGCVFQRMWVWPWLWFILLVS